RPSSSSRTSRPTSESAMRSLRRALWRTSVACGLLLTIMQARGESDSDPQKAGADVLGLSGSVRAADFSKDKSFSGKTGYAVGSIWVTATPQELWGIKTYFDGRAQGQDLARSGGVTGE